MDDSIEGGLSVPDPTCHHLVKTEPTDDDEAMQLYVVNNDDDETSMTLMAWARKWEVASHRGINQPVLLGENKVLPSVTQYIAAFRELYLLVSSSSTSSTSSTSTTSSSTSSSTSSMSDLRQLILPVFAFLYVEIVLYGSKLFADKFLTTLSDCFHRDGDDDDDDDDDGRRMLSLLSSVKSRSDLERNPQLEPFLRNKYRVSLSAASWRLLVSSLAARRNHLITKIINANIIVDVTGDDDDDDDEYEVPMEEGDRDDVDDDVEHFLSLSHRTYSAPPILPSIRHHTITSPLHCICAHLSSDGGALAHSLDDHSIHINQMTSPSHLPHSMLRGHTADVYCLRFVSTKHVLSCSSDHTVRLWSPNNDGQFINVTRYQGHHCPVWCVDVDRTSRYLVSGAADATARLFTPERDQVLRLYSGHLLDVDSTTFHPNSSYFTTSSADHSLRLWDLHSGRCERILTATTGVMTFSPCGHYLACGGDDGAATVFDLRMTRHHLAHAQAHTSPIHTLTYSCSGVLVTGGGDGVVRVWNPSSGLTLIRSYPTTSPIYSLSYPHTHPLLLSVGYEMIHTSHRTL